MIRKMLDLCNSYARHNFEEKEEIDVTYDNSYLVLGRDKYNNKLVGIDAKDAVRVLMLGQPGCLVSGTKVQTLRGDVDISELDDAIDKIKAYDFNKHMCVECQFKKIDAGLKEVYTILTANGDCIECSCEHIWFVKRNNKIIEVKTSDLLESDELVSK